MEITKREGECTEGVFWDCISEISWPVKSSTLVKARILRAWSPEFGTSFQKILEAKTDEVGRVFREYEEQELSASQRDRYYLSDDGIGDFCSHVVGLGWAVFNDEVRHPEKLVKRAIKRDFEECFSYVIPYEPTWQGKTFEEWAEAMGYDLREENFSTARYGDRDFEEHISLIHESYMRCVRGDWRNIEPDHYVKWAERLLPDCAAFLANLSAPTAVDEEADAAEHASVLTRYLNLLVNEETEEALEMSEQALQSWWTLYHIAVDIGALRSAHAALLPMVGNGTYSGENLINDHRQYMGQIEGFKCRFHLTELQRKKAS